MHSTTLKFLGKVCYPFESHRLQLRAEIIRFITHKKHWFIIVALITILRPFLRGFEL
jgi:hypothetical protein